MRKIIFVLTLFFIIGTVNGQDQQKSRFYWKSASEFIFSYSDVEARSSGENGFEEIDVNPVVRFSGFFHLQEQLHLDFSKNIGIFTGLGVRNVGMINKLNDSIKVKQRSYTIGIPLALKIGNLPGGFFIAAGGEAELFFHYKQKVFYDDEKYKRNEWFSDKVNIFNPSVFVDVAFNRGSYIRFKYYLMDFLAEDNQVIKNINGNIYPFYPVQSQLFYVALGTAIKHKSRTAKRAKNSVIIPTGL